MSSSRQSDAGHAWTPGETSGTAHNECDRCGAHVSRQFARCFGVDGVVHGCLECCPKSWLSRMHQDEPRAKFDRGWSG